MVILTDRHHNETVTGADSHRARLEQRYKDLIEEKPALAKHVSYVGNKSVPILRLYRYKEAFSFSLVSEFLTHFGITSRDYVFDPFAGMGTTLFGAMVNRVPSIGTDKLPIATFVARALPQFLLLKQGQLTAAWEGLTKAVGKAEPAEVAMDVPIMSLAFSDETLTRLRQWKSVIKALQPPCGDIFLLFLFAVLEETSYTSKDGQFLRLERAKNPIHPDKALREKVVQAEQDLERLIWLFPGLRQNHRDGFLPEVYEGDTRDLSNLPFRQPPTAIITSPPYVNRYDYTRSYSLELCFEFVRNFGELRAIRHSILRSHIESRLGQAERPPHPAVNEAVAAISAKHMNNPRIPYMLTAYFIDMEKAIREWSRVLAPGAKVAMVVDNVRFEGELIPVDLILSDIAQERGFEVERVIVARYKGNSSQQMGKYGRVPVRESIVIWRKR